MIGKKLDISHFIEAPSLDRFYFYVSELLHAIKYNDKDKYEDIVSYIPGSKEEYSNLQYERLVQLAAVLDFKLQGRQYRDCWFKSKDLMLDIPFFSDDLSREVLFLFAPQQFMRHNVFYDPAELEVL